MPLTIYLPWYPPTGLIRHLVEYSFDRTPCVVQSMMINDPLNHSSRFGCAVPFLLHRKRRRRVLWRSSLRALGSSAKSDVVVTPSNGAPWAHAKKRSCRRCRRHHHRHDARAAALVADFLRRLNRTFYVEIFFCGSASSI
jgi:hypothetical protein